VVRLPSDESAIAVLGNFHEELTHAAVEVVADADGVNPTLWM
jgi:hypothetical protein